MNSWGYPKRDLTGSRYRNEASVVERQEQPGPPGYAAMLEALADPGHKRRAEVDFTRLPPSNTGAKRRIRLSRKD
jgi:hypothetical protein